MYTYKNESVQPIEQIYTTFNEQNKACQITNIKRKDGYENKNK